MIVMIWPVKGTQGLKNAKRYIEDERKVIDVKAGRLIQLGRSVPATLPEEFLGEDIGRVLEYMADGDKIKGKYISGYMCDPETTVRDFTRTREEMVRTGRETDKGWEKENLCYHLIQSFPEDLNISDEEVHQCGLELLQKIGCHQGIVCSHVHPVMDEKREVHGRCKHNHILINAYKLPNRIDPKRPGRIKYHDCNESYAQLQVWNDEVAIDHGLPIIRNPGKGRMYSWYEKHEEKQGQSWKEPIRLDIQDARRLTGNWNEFVSCMVRVGYQIRDGAHVTYTAPDGKHKVRGERLGRPYTKENLELYWAIRDKIELEIDEAVRYNTAPPLWTLTEKYGPLSAAVPIGTKSKEDSPVYSLPLKKAERSRDVLCTYFNRSELYDVTDVSGNVVAQTTGKELINYLDALRRGENEHWEEQQRKGAEQQERFQQEEMRRRREEEKEKKKKYYAPLYRNSRTGRRYRVNLRDEMGNERTIVELLLMLAILVLKGENGLWDLTPPKGKEKEAVFGGTDWKIQNMLDAIHIATEEQLHTPVEVDKRAKEVGAAYSRARSWYQNARRAQGKMETLDKALDDFENTRKLVERIYAVPDSPEKEQVNRLYADEIKRYKCAREVMYAYGVTTWEQIDDFRRRYDKLLADLPNLEQRYEETKEDYRRIKKLQYHIQLAQNEQYCYGPGYEKGKVPEKAKEQQKVRKREIEFER